MACKRLNSKEKTKNGTSKKPLMIMLSAVLICAVVVGGTFAYLTWHDSKTNEFKNNAILEAVLEESEWRGGLLVPGAEIKKNPTVTVKKGSEDCYAFMALKNNLLDREGTELATFDINTSDWERLPVTDESPYSLYIYKGNLATNYVIEKSSTSDVALNPLFKWVTVITTATQEQLSNIQDPTVKVAAFLHQSHAVNKADATTAAIAHFDDLNNWN